MKKIRVVGIIWLSILSVFLYLDSKAYYYGFGQGFLSAKIPSRFSVLFAGSDLGNQGMVLKEKDLNLWIINCNDSIFMSDTEKKIMIKKFVGYWFNNKTIVAKVKDNNNKNRYIEIYEEVTNALYSNFICKEMRYPPDEYDDLKYIDLDKSLVYFKRFKLIKNLTIVLFVFMSLYGLRLFYLRRKKSKT
ncbi:hypothetical protein ACM55F_06980 [Flavobacterium sp. XS2P12]|uniref:hypothetical protein n=1 Tax=Flavobacterium melibiosi TaxID=3398734 RepID=UPI003A857C3D